MADRYTIYQGSFVCHECKETVQTMRHYPNSKMLTWVCSRKHLSSVSIQTRKRKQDYDRKV